MPFFRFIYHSIPLCTGFKKHPRGDGQYETTLDDLRTLELQPFEKAPNLQMIWDFWSALRQSS